MESMALGKGGGEDQPPCHVGDETQGFEGHALSKRGGTNFDE